MRSDPSKQPNATREIERIISIDPWNQGFAFVVLEARSNVLAWGCGSRAIDQPTIRKTMRKLINLHRPDFIILPNTKCIVSSRRKSILEQIRLTPGVRFRFIKGADVRQHFKQFGAITKHQIAITISNQLPQLADLLPAPRKPYQGENPRMNIFDAAALALTYNQEHKSHHAPA